MLTDFLVENTIVIAEYCGETAVIGQIVQANRGWNSKVDKFPPTSYDIRLMEPIKGNKFVASKKKGDRIKVQAADVRYFYSPDEVQM